MGPIQDRTREHLGSTDVVIMANRRQLQRAMDTVKAGGTPPLALAPEAAQALTGPHTIDCFAPTEGWEAHWRERAEARRAMAPWRCG